MRPSPSRWGFPPATWRGRGPSRSEPACAWRSDRPAASLSGNRRSSRPMKAVFKSGTGGGKSPFERYIVTHPMGDIIFSEGEIGNEMYILQSGTVELIKAIGKETRVLATLEKGDFFGEMSVLEDLPRTASARAKTDVELVRINGATFDSMLKGNTEIAGRMMRKLSRRLRDVTAVLGEAA